MPEEEAPSAAAVAEPVSKQGVPWLWVGVGAGAVAIIVIVAVISRRKKG